MTEEEKKAMIHIKEFLYKDRGFITADECEIFFNYISKLQEENKELKAYKRKHSLIKNHYVSKDKIKETKK